MTRSRSSSRRWRTPASPPNSCRRGTGRPTSSTSSRAATRPGTTPTSGRRCSTPTPWSGSRRTAACAGRTATRSGRSCSPSAARSTRWPPSAPSAAATPTPARCCAAAASPPPRRLAAPAPGSCARFAGPAEPPDARTTPLERGRQPLTARAAAAPGRGRRGLAVPDQPVGLAVAADRAAVHDLPALARLLHQPDRLHRGLAVARPVARQLVDVQRPQAVRAVVAVVPVGVGGHGRRAVDADEAGVLRPPGAAHACGQGTNGSMPTTSTLMSRPLGAW